MPTHLSATGEFPSGESAVNVASALEQYAHEYKRNIDATHFLRARKVVVDYLLDRLSPNSRVLDINCGTGVDVVEIANHGHYAMGVDISSAMISFARENIVRAKLTSRADIDVCDFRELPVPDFPFDAVLSNFGGINFVQDLRPVFLSVDRSLRKGGFLIVNSVSHFCLMETLIFLSTRNFYKAFRRLTRGKARIGGKLVQLFYHEKKELVSVAREVGYNLIDTFGLNIFAPPLWAEDFFTSHKNISNVLEQVDSMVRHVPLFRTTGDFMVLVFKKG